MPRIFLCFSLAAACCCCFCCCNIVPVQGRRPAGMAMAAAAGGLSGHRLRLRPVPLLVPTETEAPVVTKAARPSSWSPAAAAAGSVRPELRAVPGGPDPLHHHGGSPSRRPEPEQDRSTPSP